MRYVLLNFTVFIITCISATAQRSSSAIDWADSVSIQEAIDRLPVCEQIRLANDSVHVFAKGQGDCLRLLQSISKATRSSIKIPIGIAGMLITDEDRLADLREQLAAIRRKFCEG